MVFKRKIYILIYVAAFGLSACARRPAPLIVDYPEDIEKPPEITEVVLIARLDFAPPSGPLDYTRKVLGEFRDGIEKLIEFRDPFVIAVSPHMIRSLPGQQNIKDYIENRILKDPNSLTEEDIKYFSSKYETDRSTGSLLNAQVQEILSMLGNSLKKSETARYIISKSSYSAADKNMMIDFIKSEILVFEEILIKALDRNNIKEAVTSLSDSYLGLLDDDRIRTQIMEGIVAYKRWRGEFPEGFIPRSGFINLQAADNIQRTGIDWVLMDIPDGIDMTYNTKPRVVETALIAGVLRAAYLLESKDFKSVDVNRYLASKYVAGEDTVELSGTDLVSQSWHMLEKEKYYAMFLMLEEARDAIAMYRDSGRARIDVLSSIRSNLLIAESGVITDNIDYPFYDRVFRKALIDIYRAMGAGAPAGLFLPVTGFTSVEAENTSDSVLSIDVDGRISAGEWDEANYFRVPDAPDGVGKIYWGADENNMYFALEISSPIVETAGVYLGHEAVPAASLTPRGMDYEIENILGFPIYIEANWRRHVPDRTVIHRAAGRENWETLTGHFNVGHSEDALEFAVPLRYLGARPHRDVFVKFYVNDRMYPEDGFYSMRLPDVRTRSAAMYYIDPAGDAYGPGNYSFPQKYRDLQSNFDLRFIEVSPGIGENIITVGFSDVSLLTSPATDFFNPVLDIYIDINRRVGAGRVDMLAGRKAYTTPEDAWEYAIVVAPDHRAIYNTAGRKIGQPRVNINQFSRTVNIFVPETIIGASLENWGVIPVVLAGREDGSIVEIKSADAEEMHITGRRTASDTNIIDVILPSGHTQREILGANRRGGAVTIPALR